MTRAVHFGVRHSDQGFIFDVKGSSCFVDNGSHNLFLGFLGTKLVKYFLDFLNPTTENQIGNISSLPISNAFISNEQLKETVSIITTETIEIARQDWDSFETSWDFQLFPLLRCDLKAATVEVSFNNWQAHCNANIGRMQELETENKRLFITAYGLEDELTPEVSETQITLARPDREE